MKQIVCLAVVLSSILLFSGLSRAATIQVSPNGSPDCTVLQPCALQIALNTAAGTPEDDTLQLEPGTYTAPFIYFGVNGGALTIIGNGAIIDGGRHLDGLGNIVGKPGLIVTTINPNLSDATFTITITGITFQNGVFQAAFDGGGLSIQTNSAPVNIRNCNFRNNVDNNPANNAAGGGGLSVLSQNSGDITLVASNFDRNISVTNGGGGGAFLASVLGDISAVGNTFTNNIAINSSGSLGGPGGGLFMASEGGSVTASRNFFSGNLGSPGGGMFGANVLGNLVITDSIFSGNQAVEINNTEGLGGGAFFATVLGSFTATNNTFTGNKVTNGNGGGFAVGLLVDSDTGDIYNNIIFNNLATGSTCPGTCNDVFILDDGDNNHIGAPTKVFNNDFADISFGCQATPAPTAATPNPTPCASNNTVDTNIDQDPKFTNAGGGNFHLLASSLAIDAGTAAAPHLPALDFDGKLRTQGSDPDMGAFEFTPSHTTPSTPEDCANNVDDDGDGKIDCNDSDCASDPSCTVTNPPPGTENCGNNVDDDGDHLIDCADPDCSGAASCINSGNTGSGTENCANNVDDDNDGQIDCSDGDCSGAAACRDSGGSDSGAGGGNGQGSNITVNSGCSLATGAESAPSLFWLLAPLLLAAGRIVRNLNVGRHQ